MAAEPGLAEKVVLIDRAFDRAGVDHAFGGALALAYYAEPRTTVDVDVNVFVPPERVDEILELLRPFGVNREPAPDDVVRDGQGRLWWGANPIDLFFAYDPVHDAMRAWKRDVPFGADTIPILAPEHLIVPKVIFNRGKDWLDIEQMLVAVPALDFAEIARWLDHLVGSKDKRAQRFEELREQLA
jgi:hypothetical protein